MTSILRSLGFFPRQKALLKHVERKTNRTRLEGLKENSRLTRIQWNPKYSVAHAMSRPSLNKVYASIMSVAHLSMTVRSTSQ
jgi:hypothetical protein